MKNNGKGEVIGFGDNEEPIRKPEKSKSQNLAKSQKLVKSRKKSLKSENSLNFNIKEKEPSFLTLSTRKAFNRLRLAFIKALIF